jgi:uncharacterized protein YlxW (UPF0749 family)
MTPDHVRDTARSAWRTLALSFVPRPNRGQLITGLLCALVGFGLVVQVRASRDDGLSSLRQDELVRLLDDVTRRGEQLEDQIASLRAQRNELVSGSDTERAAREAAAQRAAVQGILAGQLPAQGPGIELIVRDPGGDVLAPVLYNVLEELRNAGAEVIQVGRQRLTASSYIVDAPEGIEVDGVVLSPPYSWLVIGDPETITTALSIPGGALAAVRNAGGIAELSSVDRVEITAVREVDRPEYATPAPAAEGG